MRKVKLVLSSKFDVLTKNGPMLLYDGSKGGFLLEKCWGGRMDDVVMCVNC